MSKHVLQSEVRFWARSQVSCKTSLQHAWYMRPNGRLGTACGIHAEEGPLPDADRFRPRSASQCRLCPKNILNDENDAGAAAALARRRAGSGLDVGLTVQGLTDAIADGDRPRLATALLNHATALVAQMARDGVDAEAAFLRLAIKHSWGYNLRDALHRARTHAIKHQPKRPKLLKAHADEVERLRQGPIRDAETIIYHLVALIGLHAFDSTFLADILHPPERGLGPEARKDANEAPAAPIPALKHTLTPGLRTPWSTQGARATA